MLKKFWLLSILVVVFLFSCTPNAENSSANAADFKLQDLNGKTVRLSDYKGKAVMIDFWATWCPPCRESIPGIIKIHKSYGGKGLIVLGISLDQGGWESVNAFANEYGMSYPILKGNDDVMAAYHVRTIPMIVLLNKEGKIVKRYLGFGGEDEIEREIKALL